MIILLLLLLLIIIMIIMIIMIITQSFSEIFGLLSSLLKTNMQGKTLRPALAEKSKHHRDVCLPSGWSGPPLHVSHCPSLSRGTL